MTFQLTDTEKRIVTQVEKIGHHIRSLDRDYFLDRVRALSREAFDRLPEAAVSGPMFDQTSAALSAAQDELRTQAIGYVGDFEERVSYVREPDPERDTWRPKALEPTRTATLAFGHSVHELYPDAPSFLNIDERAMAQALDTVGDGWWMRNPPTRAMGGYGLPMPVQVGGSQTFFPDFLWWTHGTCYAVDTTGVHILPPKVRGKLLLLAMPHVALVTRGRVAPSLDTQEDKAGWTLVLPGAAGPRRTHHDDISDLLQQLAASVAP